MNEETQAWYPLRLVPELHARVWGGRQLGGILGVAMPDGPVGESWSMGTDNRVADGPLAGQSLGAVIARDPAATLGRTVLASGRTDLPLLFKIIDAAELLSIQVHPDDRYARTVEGAAFGKSEAWHILAATPGAYVIHGFSRPVTTDEIRAGLGNGAITDLLRRVELQAGDTFYVPAGTVHAIGGGLLLAEIQENSDLTYRLYDWGRPRELHIDRSLAVLHARPPGFGLSRPLAVAAGSSSVTYLVACRYFVYQALDVADSLDCDTEGHSFHVLFAQHGTGTLVWKGGSASLQTGETVFVPAALRRYRINGSGLRLLRAFVPDVLEDVISPLLDAGHPAAAIAALGGGSGNELERAIAPICNV